MPTKSKILPYTRMRKYRMLSEWIWKTFWPECTKCGKQIEFDPVVEGQPLMPFVNVKERRLEHATCHDLGATTLRARRLAVRLMAYRQLLGSLLEFYDVKCWYCLLTIRGAALTSGFVELTLHHVDEDRGDERLRGKNEHAELELLHEECHKRHHIGPTTYKTSLDRVNGVRSDRPRHWRYEK